MSSEKFLLLLRLLRLFGGTPPRYKMNKKLSHSLTCGEYISSHNFEKLHTNKNKRAYSLGTKKCTKTITATRTFLLPCLLSRAASKKEFFFGSIAFVARGLCRFATVVTSAAGIFLKRNRQVVWILFIQMRGKFFFVHSWMGNRAGLGNE